MVKKDVVVIDNLEIDKKKKTVVVSINPRIHPIDIVFSAAYILMDRAYVIIDGDPNSQILVKLRVKKDDENLEQIGREFNNELVNYQFYAAQTLRNQPLRELIMRRAFFTQDQDVKSPAKKNEIELIEEEIAKPWKENVGNKKVDESEKKRANKNRIKP